MFHKEKGCSSQDRSVAVIDPSSETNHVAATSHVLVALWPSVCMEVQCRETDLRSYFREKAPHFSGIRSAITFQNLQAINFPLGCGSLHAVASSVVEQGWWE